MKKITAQYMISIEQHNDIINHLGSNILAQRIESELAQKLVNELISGDNLYIRRSCKDYNNLVYESSIFIIDEVSLMKLQSIINNNIDNLSIEDYHSMIRILIDK